MSSKQISFLFFIILLVSSMSLSQVDALEIGPRSFELDLQIDGSNSTIVYFSSDGALGELVIGKEDLPFRIEPLRINMSSEDAFVPIELTFYGNESLEAGVYEGKVTFIAYTGEFFAVGIKIGAKINLIGDVHEHEISIDGDELPNRTVSIVVDDQIKISGSSEELVEESKNDSILPYLILGVGMVLVALIVTEWQEQKGANKDVETIKE